MDKTPYYFLVWSLIVLGTITQVIIFDFASSDTSKVLGILTIAFLQVVLSSAIFWNLRYEARFLSLFPLLTLLFLVAFAITAIFSVM